MDPVLALRHMSVRYRLVEAHSENDALRHELRDLKDLIGFRL
jgi:hypothetical protein